MNDFSFVSHIRYYSIQGSLTDCVPYKFKSLYKSSVLYTAAVQWNKLLKQIITVTFLSLLK